MSDTLTPKQERFCEEYIVDLNATQAAIRAGYGEAGARTEGSRLLANVDIQSRISTLIDERSQRVQVTADEIIRELLLIAKSDIGDYYDDDGNLLHPKNMPPHRRRAIAGIDVLEEKDFEGNVIGHTKKLRLWDKPRALMTLIEHLPPSESEKDHDTVTVKKVSRG